MFIPFITESHSLRVCHTLPDIVNGRPTENKIFNPFVSVSMRFLSVSISAMSVSHAANALLARRGPFNPAKVWNGLHRKKAPAGCMVAMRWHAVCSELVRSLPCTCPVRNC